MTDNELMMVREHRRALQDLVGKLRAELAAMRDERDKALADVAKYADRSESFASAIDHLVDAGDPDLARVTKERDDFRDGIVAMLVAAGAPEGVDAMEAAVTSAGKKPSDFIRQRIRVLTEERDAIWKAHRDAVDERDALLRNINDAFMSLNIPRSTMAFDGRNLLPHTEESARYAEALRAERDALQSQLERATTRQCYLDMNASRAIAAARGGA